MDFDTAAGDDFDFIFIGVGEPADVVEQVDRATTRHLTEGLGDQPTAAQSQGQGPQA